MKQKKVGIIGILIVSLMLSTNIFSASVIGTQNQQITTLQEMIFSSNNQYNSPFLNFLIGRLYSPFPWSLLHRSVKSYKLNTFSSYDDFIDFLKENNEGYANQGYWEYMEDGGTFLNVPKAANQGRDSDDSSSGESSVEYSTTNIQVEGVDEPDTVKTDGSYIYNVANSKVYIIKAAPAADALVLSEISIDSDSYNNNIFINDDRLIIMGTSYRYPDSYEETDYYWYGGVTTTVIKIYDISDKQNPNLLKDIEIDGNYFDSRMIDNYIYVVATEYSSNIYLAYEKEETINIPRITIDEQTTDIPYDQIYYVDIPESIDTMTHVISINIDDSDVSQKSFLLGSSQSMYVSKNNVFLACTKYEYFAPLLENMYGYSEQKTIIHKISVDSGDITYTAQGEVPGTILNQFSMDEYDGYFRIATTIGDVWNTENPSTNNIYVLDSDLVTVGKLEDLAPGEQIYSSRFMGEKAYLVTFKKIDPFFTIDLSDPYNPKVIGKLKIPGYSDYLHPYDENHIIGIGKDTVDPQEDQEFFREVDFAWYQGLKIAIFDVSDFDNPIELDKIIIGDRGTDSNALYDHKAFLFDLKKNLLVIPVNLYEIDEQYKDDEYTGSIYGEFTYQGAYVFDLSKEDGIDLRGRITHIDDLDEEFLKSGYYWYGGGSSVTRSLYIGDVLYTFSDSMIKMNNLDTLDEINSVALN